MATQLRFVNRDCFFVLVLVPVFVLVLVRFFVSVFVLILILVLVVVVVCGTDCIGSCCYWYFIRQQFPQLLVGLASR